MQRLGKSVEELARETVEEILGYIPPRNEGDGDKSGHKPARPDIQKMQDAYDLYNRAYPEGVGGLSMDEVGAAYSEWQEKFAVTDRDRRILQWYNQIYRNTRSREESFKKFALILDAIENRSEPSTEREVTELDGEPTTEGKRAAGALLKKYEEAHYPIEYKAIVRALNRLLRDKPSSYKLWPWAVKQMKSEFQTALDWGSVPENVSFRGAPTFEHLTDVVGEAGEVLSKLRAENRIPQNFDINHMNVDQLEEWLMEWKKENRESEAQGQVVYQFHDGWTIQKLTTPEQLQFEGDEMGHCLLPSALVGYTPAPDVEDDTVALGEIVYHARALPYTGRALRISTAGTLPIEVTPEHQFLVVRPKRTTPLQDRYFKNRLPENLEPMWLRANEITVGDYLLSPELDLSPTPLPSDLAWMYGVYIGDGGTNGSSKPSAPLSGIQFTLSPEDDLDRLVETLTNEGYRPKVADHGTYRRVRVNSRRLAEQFAEWFGSGSENKRMPDWLLGHPAALEGLLSADGHFKESEQSWTFTSTSRVLAQQVWLVARAQGFYPSITTYKRKEGNGYPNAKPSWKVRWQINQRRWAQNRQWREWYVTPVKSIDNFHYEGDVYSPETISHTYLVNGVICHNCVGGYAHTVGRGEDIIYSLRDPKGMPHVTMEISAISGYPADQQEIEQGRRHRTGGHEYLHPDSHDPNNYVYGAGVDENSHTLWKPSGEKAFEVVQVQGNSNKTPKPEYQRKIKEFLDALRAKGWKFVRSEDWYAPHDEHDRNVRHDVADSLTARELDDWFDNDYKTHHEQYRGLSDTDPYGLPAERKTIGIEDWSELFQDILGSLVNEYDRSRWQGHWPSLAQAVYHAWMVDIHKDHLDEEQLERHTKNLLETIQKAEEHLNEWDSNQVDYSLSYNSEDIVDRFKEVAKREGLLDQIEQRVEQIEEEEYGDSQYLPAGRDEQVWVQVAQSEHEDLWQEAMDSLYEDVQENYSGDAWKFLNYLYMLATHKGAVNPADLPDPNQRDGGLPSYEEMLDANMKLQQRRQENEAQTPTLDLSGTSDEGLPGALSSWSPKISAPQIQIHPIDSEHDVWFDEDGNQRARYRPGWAKNPETGKMEQTGELEDTFLDKHGRQGQGVVAYDGDNPVGSLTWVDDQGWHMLGTAYVHPNYREQGIFNQMVAPLRETGRPIDAYVWNNPWLKSKVRSWR